MRRLAVALIAALTLTACTAPETVGDSSVERVKKTATKKPGPSKSDTESSVRQLARGPVSTGWRVSRIVDGDTVDVRRGGRTLTLRLIGIDTPETVHPTEPIECFGPEATRFAQRRLLGEPAVLEFDRSQGRLDYYGRTLAYVWTTRGAARQFNLDAVRHGYALEYTYDDPYLWQREFQRAEALANSARRGVWDCAHPGS